MKKNLLITFLLLTAGILSAQVVWEDFENGANLNWVAADGVYNGVIANPDTSGINQSDSVGSYTKGFDRGFSLFRVQMDTAFDLTENNIFRMQVWSPIATEVLLKLEGGGNAVEDRKSIQDSAWTELTFDFRSKSDVNTMTDMIIFFSPGNNMDSSTYYFDNIIAEPAPSEWVLEDFEDGPRLNWEARNGTFTGVVENPATDGINPSLNVGSYTKSDSHSFSLFIHEQEEPLDLSLLNRAKIQIYSPVKTEFILKLEGSGEAKEVRMNIPSANVWREYVMDFSDAADFTTITKIILFFDPGVEESGDTYLFDNLVLLPPDECAGTVPIPGVVDNFECQRNATYDNGWDQISAVDNPDLSTVNSTAKVGQYVKPATQAWATLVADYDNAIDLSTLNVLHAKVWSPVGKRMLFKLEGGASPAREIFLEMPDSNTWVDFTADFSQYAAEDHKRIAIFFAAGTAYEEDVTFYIDEIMWAEKMNEATILEDFEDGGQLAWFPTNNDMGNGTFEIIDNPDATAPNESASVGSYSRGSNAFSSLTAILSDPLDLSEMTQLNLMIWAPEGASTVTMQLVSPVEGNKDATRDISSTGEWITVSFDFGSSASITDFGQLNLIFDAETEIAGPYYIDNLSQGETTVDPCEGVEVDPNIIDNFECQRNATISLGAEDLEVAPNPDITQANNSTTVGKYTEPDGPWAALVYEAAGPFDLSIYNQLNMKIWAPRQVPILFKLEGGSGDVMEVTMDVTTAEEWVNYSVDFSDAAGRGHNKLTLFMNAGQEATVGEEYYWDDIQWGLAPFETCIVNFEGDPYNPTGWTYFANGTYADSTINVVDNPLKEGVNTSDKVGRFVEAAEGDGVQMFAGAFLRGNTPINFTDPNNQTISMDILMDHEASVVFKLESGETVNTTGDVMAQYTTPNEWQTVTWDYSSFPNDQFKTISLILDFDNIPTEDKEYFIDNIRVGGTSCDISTGIFNVEPVPTFMVTPNPAVDAVRIEAPEEMSKIEIYNAMGQQVKVVRDRYQSQSEIDINEIQPGIYYIQAYDLKGKLAGHAKFIKH
ncbi:MAG: T9SS type A sorting domain-containing protein [Saprospiraceae bacterium]|nr:T9SS type A sorting domain-containing protein [Saprospiraceae bacterium]